jgi:hypothetical protein
MVATAEAGGAGAGRVVSMASNAQAGTGAFGKNVA